MRIVEQESRKPSTSIVDSVSSLSQISNVHLSFNPSPSQVSNAHLRVNPFLSQISNAHPSCNPSLSQISNTHPSFSLICGSLDKIKPHVPRCVPPAPNLLTRNGTNPIRVSSENSNSSKTQCCEHLSIFPETQ
jgi:hypothetical protein